MDCNFTTIKTCELKDSTFRSRILDFGDFDISDYTFSAVYKAGFDQIISEQEITAVGNILTVPLEAIEGASNRAKVEVWMLRDGDFKDKVIVFDVVISATGCPSDSTVTDGVSVTFGGMKVPVVITQAVYMNVSDEQLDAIAQPAIEAAALANQAATNADTAAGFATVATQEAVNATGQAIAATAQAENAAENADEAAVEALAAKDAANQAAENALSGIKGTATPATAPSPTGFERWLVHEAGTYTNFSGIVVTAADLDVVAGVARNEVVLEVNNGVSTKRVRRLKGDKGDAADPAKLPLYSAIKSANIVAGTQFIDDENGNVVYRVKAGQTLLTSELPAAKEGVKTEKVGASQKIAQMANAFVNQNFQPVTFTSISGKYINSSGVVTDSASFSITNPILLNKGDVISVKAFMANPNPVISITDATASFYTPKVIGIGVDVPSVYFFTATEDCYVALSYLTALSVIVEKSQSQQTLDLANKINERASVLSVDEILRTDLTNVKGNASVNIFDKNTAQNGNYLSSVTGNLIPNASYFTALLMVKEGDVITKNKPFSSSVFRDKNRKYISVVPVTNTVTVPSTAAYIHFSDVISDINNIQIVKGSRILPYSEYKVTVKRSSLPTEYFGQILEHLLNPFIPTQIKLIGDSITAGQGGTGYSATAENIGTTGLKANVLTATSWSNMLYNYVNRFFNRDTFVDILDSRIIVNVVNTRIGTQINAEIGMSMLQINNNAVVNNAIEFDFYGTHFSVYNTFDPAFGKYEIWVDGALVQSVDTYAATKTYKQKTTVTGLADGTHSVLFKTTNDKNTSSSGKTLVFEALNLPKKAIVKPWGISGSSSQYSPSYIATGLLSNDDDFTIVQFGTNDRTNMVSPVRTKLNLINTVKVINQTGSIPILMASCPSMPSFETDRYFHMWEVYMAVKGAADYFNMPFVDNYHAFYDYVKIKDITMSDLLPDGLHPGDLGYKVMFENIIKTLYLPLVSSDYDAISYKDS